MKRVVSTLAAVTVLAAGCAASSSSNTGADAASSVLTFGVPSDPASLDPAKDTYNIQSIMRYLSNEPIVQYRDDGSLAPALATSFGWVGKGNTTYRFTLRKDARFADGSRVTAKAVKAWLDYFKTTAASSKVVPIRSIETPEKWTVQLNLGAPNPNLPFYLAGQNWGFVNGPKALANPSTLTRQTDGAGQYTLDPAQTVTGDHYTFVPNKYYYDKTRVKFGKVIVKDIKSPSTMLQAVEAGQIDVAVGDPSTADAATRAGITVHQAPAGWDGLVLMDRVGKLSKPLADRRVRQALNYAIDRKAITAAMMGKYGKPTSEWTPLDGFDPAYQNHYSYDPNKAKQLLAAAGYSHGFTFGVVDEGYVGNLGDPMVHAIAKYLAAVDVTVKITTVSTAGAYLQKFLSGNYSAVQHEWGSAPTYVWYPGLFAQDGPSNLFHAVDPAMDRLASQGAAAPENEGFQYWVQIARRTTDQATFLPVFTYPTLIYASKSVTGLSVSKWFMFEPVMTQWAKRQG